MHRPPSSAGCAPLLVLARFRDRRRAAAPEFGDRQLRLPQPGLAGSVQAKPLAIELNALLEAHGAGLERLDGALERGDELVEGLARELLVGQDRELGLIDHEISSSLPVRSTRVSMLPRATITCIASPVWTVAASCTIFPSSVRATA